MAASRSYRPGTVVVYTPRPGAQSVFATVAEGQHPDGNVCLVTHGVVPAGCLCSVSGGQLVEYYSSSRQTWVRAQVLRKGGGPGTFDLDCKENVDICRMRIPLAEDGGPNDETPIDCTAAQATDLLRDGLRAPCVGEYCFYNSASQGWIPAKVIKVHPKQGFELNVKPCAPLGSICCIWEGDVVEYNSHSLGWIPARVLRVGQVEGTFDLDCKQSVGLLRLRPASEEVVAKHNSLRKSAQTATEAASCIQDTLLEKACADLETKQRGSDSYALREALRAAHIAGAPSEQLMVAEWALGALEARDTLRKAVAQEDPDVLRQALDRATHAGVEGEELDEAAHKLWSLDARPTAAKELRNAILLENSVALSAALEAAEVVGLPPSDLAEGRRVLELLRGSIAAQGVSVLHSTHLDLRILTPPASDHASSGKSKAACRTGQFQAGRCQTTQRARPLSINVPPHPTPNIGDNGRTTADTNSFISGFFGSAWSVWAWGRKLGEQACTSVANGELCEEDKLVSRAGNTVYITRVPGELDGEPPSPSLYPVQP